MIRREGAAARLAVALLALAAVGMRSPNPWDMGRVVMDAAARRAKVPPAIFDHYLHRARFTCRLCHVDLGFAMSAGGTHVSAATNQGGFHCGACHDGIRAFDGKPLFAACSASRRVDEQPSCRRCHARPDTTRLEAEYVRFAARLPRDARGAVDWERAEARGEIRPVDFLEGISVERRPMRMEKDVPIAARASWVDDIIFSHRKHAVWNGCEVCHPDIFPAPKEGRVAYTMFEIAGGEYCGACHDKVAFPIAACGRCHRRQVE